MRLRAFSVTVLRLAGLSNAATVALTSGPVTARQNTVQVTGRTSSGQNLPINLLVQALTRPVLLTLAALCGGWTCGAAATAPAVTTPTVADLIRAYPDALSRAEGQTLIWRDGARMPVQRTRAPSYTAMLDRAGLLDQLAQRYPACAPIQAPARNTDPGRARFEPLFNKMYGDSAGAVSARLDTVNWFGQSLRVTRVNGVAASLRRVAAEIARRPDLLPYARPSAGTFLWRKVAGTPRASVHRFGAAIDLNTAYADYWQWSGYREGQPGIRYRNRMPLALVQIFEREGWIWGGRWYHYDTMHFEYRPELLGAQTCRRSGP